MAIKLGCYKLTFYWNDNKLICCMEKYSPKKTEGIEFTIFYNWPQFSLLLTSIPFVMKYIQHNPTLLTYDSTWQYENENYTTTYQAQCAQTFSIERLGPVLIILFVHSTNYKYNRSSQDTTNLREEDVGRFIVYLHVSNKYWKWRESPKGKTVKVRKFYF